MPASPLHERLAIIVTGLESGIIRRFSMCLGAAEPSARFAVLVDARDSSFGTLSLPLPPNHWLTFPGYEKPPMPYRMGTDNPERVVWEKMLRAAGQYAYRAATMNGQAKNIDPDALIQNLIVGFLGYHTPDGLSRL